MFNVTAARQLTVDLISAGQLNINRGRAMMACDVVTDVNCFAVVLRIS